MNKIQTECLDIPIIRSCNLGCVGCMTFSDHKKIKGTVNLHDSLDWLNFWASKLDPQSITLFGGEPLLHPQFVDWALTVRQTWGPKPALGVNTNGYYLNNIFDRIPELFLPGNIQSIIVSIQTGHEPYLTKVKENIKLLQQKIVDFYLTLPKIKSAKWNLWLDETDTNKKQWFNLVINGQATELGFTVCEMYKLHWVSHYHGTGANITPVYQYDDPWYKENHGYCQAKKYLTLYRGTLYKCPPVGVLEHTLDTFELKNSAEWKPYVENYQSLPVLSADDEIIAWMNKQKTPELVCNMCGFAGPKHKQIERSHLLKPNWKYTL